MHILARSLISKSTCIFMYQTHFVLGLRAMRSSRHCKQSSRGDRRVCRPSPPLGPPKLSLHLLSGSHRDSLRHLCQPSPTHPTQRAQGPSPSHRTSLATSPRRDIGPPPLCPQHPGLTSVTAASLTGPQVPLGMGSHCHLSS